MGPPARGLVYCPQGKGGAGNGIREGLVAESVPYGGSPPFGAFHCGVGREGERIRSCNAAI